MFFSVVAAHLENILLLAIEIDFFFCQSYLLVTANIFTLSSLPPLPHYLDLSIIITDSFVCDSHVGVIARYTCISIGTNVEL